MTMGIVLVASLAVLVSAGPAVTMTSTLSRERGEAIEFSLCVSVVNDNVLPLNVSKFMQALPEGLDARRDNRRGGSN